MYLVVLSAIAAILGLLTAAYFTHFVFKQSPGTDKMIEISKAIQEGAMAFLKREYMAVAYVLVFVAIVMVFWLKQPLTGIAYIVGALFSGTAGFVGLFVSTRANARTTHAAKTGLPAALLIAFRGGAVSGMTVAGLGLLGVSLCFMIFYYLFGLDQAGATFTFASIQISAKNVFEDIIPGFGLGASTIALFARVGGGIFTKAADVGADLVGKVEAGIPEDDPRNPAVIADNVGDNVGDVAGMGADLYESYVGAIVAPLALGSMLLGFKGAILSLLIAAVGIICSGAACFLVRSKEGGHPGKALSVGTYSAAILTTIACYFLVDAVLSGTPGVNNPSGFFWAIVAGLFAGMAIGQVSEIYTSDRFQEVKDIAEAAKTGSATNILAGLAAGMRSTAWSIVCLVIAMYISYYAGEWAMTGGGLFAIGLSAIGMLATTGIVVSVDAYGPIADNAGGIAEMSHQDKSVREITDSLDSVGNTTAAIAKGFAIASAAVTALAYFKVFAEKVNLDRIDILSTTTLIGLFLGGMFPFLFSSMAIKAVGRAAFKMIEEVRRQFREIPGLREGREDARPEYGKCVDISTKAALKEMIVPSVIAVVSPIIIGLWNVEALGGYLAGSLVTGFLMAIFMANAGGAWDNAKKYIEAGNLGGKGSDTHKAAVVGDTVGDPFKDTAGPCMNILIKVMSVVAVIFAPLFIK
jgi:K(+)-stimulated pyrophosphate-energized sodium pump